MAIETFTPPQAPSVGSKRKAELKILQADFGDGYGQATRAGLRHQREVMELQWEALSPYEASLIIAFLERQGGDTPFWWTVPGEATPIKWTCDTWERTYQAGYIRLTATFKQSFNLVT